MSIPIQVPSENRDKLSSHLIAHINVKLALIGCPPVAVEGNAEFSQIVSAMAEQSREKDRLLGNYLNPADQRIQTFLYDYLAGRARDETAHAHVHPGSRRHWPACSRCRWTATSLLPKSSIPTASPTGRVAQSQKRPPHHRRESFTSPRAACRFPTTNWPCRKSPSPKCSRSPSIRRAKLCACRSPPRSRSRPNVSSRCCSARSSARRCPGSLRKNDGNPLLRRRAIS